MFPQAAIRIGRQQDSRSNFDSSKNRRHLFISHPDPHQGSHRPFGARRVAGLGLLVAVHSARLLQPLPELLAKPFPSTEGKKGWGAEREGGA